MGIKAIVDSLDEVDSKYHDLYKERDGKYELTEVEGFRTQADVDRLQSSLTKERNDHKATKSKYSFLADLEPAKVQEMLDKYPELEAAASGKIDENKLNQLLEGRLSSKTAPLQREIEKLRNELQDKEGVIETYTKKERSRLISGEIQNACRKLNVQSEAVDDATMYENYFEVDEDGRVITKDGIKGVTPGVSAEVWLTDMQSKKPHWWGASSGGGASGSRSNSTHANNPFSAKHWNLTEQGRIFNENPTKAEQLAKAAGTTVGGARPAQ